MADHKIRIVVEGKDEASGALKKAGGALNDFGKGAQDVGLKLSLGITAPLVGLSTLAFKASLDLNAAMANVASLGVPTERVNELKTAVQDMSISVGKDTGDLADGLYQVVSAFGNTADTVKILEVNAKAGAAGLATTTDAINLTSAVTKGYGDTSVEAVQKVSDLAFVAVKLGQTTFPDLAASIGKVTPFAKDLNITQEDLFATFATATGVMGGAAEVSTGLRAAMQGLMSPTKDMTGLLDKLGYANGAALVKSQGMKGAFDLIAKAAKDSGKPLTAYISSIEGAGLVSLLAGEQSDAFVEKLAAMQDATGATEGAFAAQTEGVNKFGFALAQARQKGAVFLQRFGDAIAPTLMEAVGVIAPLGDKLVNLANSFNRLSPATRKWIVIFGGLAAAIGPIMFAVGTAISFLAPAVGAVGAAFTLLLGPVGLVVGALTALWLMDFGGLRTKVSAFVSNFIKNIDRIPLIATGVLDAISWIWRGPEQAANIDWWGDITHDIETLLGLDFGSLDGLSEKLFNAGVVAGGVIDIFKKLGEGGSGMAQSIANDVAAIGQATGATIDVTAGVTTVDWGDWTYKYDATSGITRVDWTWPGMGTYKYNSTTGITSIDWTGKLGDYTRLAFSYDSAAGVKYVEWNEDLFKFIYDADAGVIDVDFANGLFKGHYDSDSSVTNVLWGVFQHYYSSQATIFRVAWGAYEHLYDAQSQITEDSVLWGLWTNTYDAKANVAETDVLWGAWSFTYDAKAQVKESDILWGLYTNTYDVQASVGESGVLWGLWTWKYSASAGVTNVTFAGGLGKTVGDWFKGAIESGQIATANIATPDWLTSLLAWSWPSIPEEGWISGLLSWKWPGIPDIGWISGLLSWKWPSFEEPGWLKNLLSWKWPSLPGVVQNLLGGGGTTDDGQATGTPFWRGGQTWVGEKGPELVSLPRGSRVFNHERSMAMASAGAGGDVYNVTFAPVVNSDIDLEVAFNRFLQKLGRRRP